MTTARWRRIHSMLALGAACVAVMGLGAGAQPAAQRQPTRVRLSFSGPAEVNMPVWAHVEYVNSDYRAEQIVRYPFSRTPWYLGEYDFEVKREDKALAPVVPKRPICAGMSKPGWSAAPPTSPKARLPLHLQYRLDQPGDYQVRLRLNQPELGGSRKLIPVSDWTLLEVKASTSTERHAWLDKMRQSVPKDRGLLVGDFLPSLLACPDEEILPLLRQCMRHSDPFVEGYALNGLSYYGDEVIRKELMDLLCSNGPTDLLAYVVSWQRDLLQPEAPQLVDILSGYLKSDSPVQVGGALHGLLFVKAHYTWGQQPDMPGRIEAQVFGNMARIRAFKQREVLQPLCLFLGSAKTEGDRAREALWGLSKDPAVREQALICIGWRKDPRGLPEFGKAILDDDPSARSLPYQMRRGYGKDALPYLLKGLQAGGNESVRYECAKELTLEGRPEGYAYLAKCIRGGGRYRERAMQDVRDHFREENRTSEEQILKFLDAKARAP